MSTRKRLSSVGPRTSTTRTPRIYYYNTENNDPTTNDANHDNGSTIDDSTTEYRRRRRTGSLSKPSDDTTTQDKPKTPPNSRYTPPLEVFQSGGGEAEEREPVQHLQSRFQLEMNGVPATETSAKSIFLVDKLVWLLKLFSFSILASIIYVDIHILYKKNRKYLAGVAGLLFLLFLMPSWSGSKTTTTASNNVNTNTIGGADVQQIYNDLKSHLDSELDKLSFEANQPKQSEQLREEMDKFIASVSEQLNNLKAEVNKEGTNVVVQSDDSIKNAVASLTSTIAKVERDIQDIRDRNEGLSSSLASLRDIQNSLTSVVSSVDTLHAHHSKFMEEYKSLKSSLLEFVSRTDLKNTLEQERGVHDKKFKEIEQFVSQVIADNVRELKTELLSKVGDNSNLDSEAIKSILDTQMSSTAASINNLLSDSRIKQLVLEAFKEEIESSSSVIISQIQSIIQKQYEARPQQTSTSQTSELTREEVEKMIQEAIRVYDQDKLAKIDYALASGGGSIVLSRTSLTYTKPGSWMDWLVKRGYYSSPSLVIEPNNAVGNCWPFPGSHGNVTIRLVSPITPDEFTLEHISQNIAYNFTSCPKDFRVWGFKNERDFQGVLLGTYTYEKGRHHIQSFLSKTIVNQPVSLVTLEILSNYGNPEYTCIYRFRVHGKPPK